MIAIYFLIRKREFFGGFTFNKEVIGSIVLHNISLDNNYAEIGYKLKPEFQKRGFMSEALKVVIDYGFRKLRIKTMEAFTHKNNIASIALLKKFNFIYQPERKCKTFDFNCIFKLENIP